MSAPRIESKIATDSEEVRARSEHNRALAKKLRADVAEAAKGGPEKHRQRHVERGKLLPRDRVERLLDPGSPFLVIGQLAAQLREHDANVARHLKDYFDPKSGRLAERLERLVAKDGELERLMRGQVGRDDSELARALAEGIGAESPIMKALSPAEASGVVASLRDTVARALDEHRARITREFSLDWLRGRRRVKGA